MGSTECSGPPGSPSRSASDRGGLVWPVAARPLLGFMRGKGFWLPGFSDPPPWKTVAPFRMPPTPAQAPSLAQLSQLRAQTQGQGSPQEAVYTCPGITWVVAWIYNGLGVRIREGGLFSSYFYFRPPLFFCCVLKNRYAPRKFRQYRNRCQRNLKSLK